MEGLLEDPGGPGEQEIVGKSRCSVGREHLFETGGYFFTPNPLVVLKPSQRERTGVGVRDDCGWKFLIYF